MYKIVGADGRVYGPITADQIKQWIAEGRANAQTHTLAEGAAAWKPLGQFPEFASYFPAQVPPPIPTPIPPLAAASPRKINGNALLGLVFGVLSFLCCCRLLFAPLGIIFSLIGLTQINQNPERYEGRSVAIVGLVLSVLGLIIAFIVLIYLIANGRFHYSYYNHLMQ